MSQFGRLLRYAVLLGFLSVAVAASEPTTRPPLRCADIEGLAGAALDGPGFMVGDMHGTEQAPAFLEALVCHVLAKGHGVLLGVEMPVSEQRALDAFLGNAAPDARARFLASPFWHRALQDGRSSVAMLRMLTRMQTWIQAGEPIRVAAFDPSVVEGRDANARDAGMSASLRPAAAGLRPNEKLVVFVGNAHARKVEGSPFKDVPLERVATKPLGYLVRDLGLLHLDVAGDGGSAWVCMETCGATTLRPPGPPSTAFRIAPSRRDAFDGEYHVGPFSASPPAVEVSP